MSTEAASGSGPFGVQADLRPIGWLYLLYAIPCLLLFSVIMAPMQVADEFAHTLRADQISHAGLLRPIGGLVDAGLDRFGHLFEGLYFHSELHVTATTAQSADEINFDGQMQDENFQNTAQYGPLLYLPDALALWLGRHWGMSVAHAVLLARCLNGLVAAAIASVALARLRHGRTLAFSVLLLPMTLSAFGSVSQDAQIIALSLLAAGLVSESVAERRSLTSAQLLGFALIVVATTMARPSQLVLLALLLAVPQWKQRPAVLLGATLAVGLALAFWIVLLRLWLMPPTPPDWSVNRQFWSIVAAPLELPRVVLTTFWQQGHDLADSIVGRLGWYDTPLPDWLCVLGLWVLCLSWAGTVNVAPYARSAATALLVALLALMAISAALYLSWTPVGKPTIDGLQGRYFLPVLPLLGWLRPPKWCPQVLSRLSWAAALLFPLVSAPVTVMTIADRYYGGLVPMWAALRLVYAP